MRGPTGYRVVGSLKWGDSEATPSFLPKEYIPQKKEIWLIGSEWTWIEKLGFAHGIA